ncbi:basic amino acid ABC transporter substrate-binding protein [Caldalkalibacillus mannanilyticus]|uniref:basic amino acid ABC transporter substrate-binding protein n=1 Tax=Caldalkalibacillus mannanilyticus TaxID=1418 RepID=UPI000468FEB5|nr:basic amino acid ABC transporter substrate-binding protein [Caldalkalibacillus mannanilyticus]
MKLRKGLVFIAIISLLALALVGCGSKETAGDGKKLVVGTDAAFPPFEYLDKGKIVGFDVDFLEAVMKEAGIDYELRNIGWDPLFAALQSKEIDLAISGITINDVRKQTYDFSHPYFESTHMILFKEGVDVKGAQDIVDMKIGVQNGTTGQSAVEKLIGVNHPNIAKYENNVVAIMALKNGDVEVVVTDNTVVNEYIKNNPDDNLIGVSDTETFEAEYYGLMFPKGSEHQEKISAAIKTVIENGTYAEIYEKWFGTTPDIDALLNAK